MKVQLLIIFVTILFLKKVHSSIDVSDELEEMTFLSKYGYMEPFEIDDLSHMNETRVRAALERFQSFYGLDVTGKMNNKMKEMMKMPRCGMKDIMTKSEVFALTGNKWNTVDLTYRIARYPREVPRASTDQLVQAAFNTWSQVINLRFRPASGRTNFAISFVTGEHGDGNAFDGPGRVLAHAYFPQNGNIHFDDTERWTVQGGRGINLFQVAVHEFGHALGLPHSEVRSAVMFPTYTFKSNFRLDQDDIRRITNIYQRSTNGGPAPAPPQPRPGGGAGNGGRRGGFCTRIFSSPRFRQFWGRACRFCRNPQCNGGLIEGQNELGYGALNKELGYGALNEKLGGLGYGALNEELGYEALNEEFSNEI